MAYSSECCLLASIGCMNLKLRSSRCRAEKTRDIAEEIVVPKLEYDQDIGLNIVTLVKSIMQRAQAAKTSFLCLIKQQHQRRHHSETSAQYDSLREKSTIFSVTSSCVLEVPSKH